MELTTFETDAPAIRAGHARPCGCDPSVTHERGGATATSGCCCGNESAPASEQRLTRWGEPVMAAWLVGPSVHPEPAANQAGHDHHEDGDDPDGAAVDPVCGMTVEPAAAMEKGLHRQHEGVDYYFCGKGCYLEFGDDPGRYLDPSYAPSM